MPLTLVLPDETATEALGRRLADAACPGDVIALEGPLGAGKTTLARAFIRHLTSPGEDVPSPTFTLVQTYAAARAPIWHFDLFRLSHADEAIELGIEDAFAEGIVLIEWPERLGTTAAGAAARSCGWRPRPRAIRATRLWTAPRGKTGWRRWPMSERQNAIADFIAAAGWGGAALSALAGDASFRRYWRVTEGARRAVLMDAPPDKLDLRSFLTIDAHLRGRGYSAPEIYAADATVGLALLEDLGDHTIAAQIEAGGDAMALYGLAIDWLVDLHKRGVAALPAGLPRYDDERLLEEVSRFLLWYVPAVRNVPLSETAQKEWDAIWRALLPVARAMPETMVYRDFFAENLMALPRPGLSALGLLDFQDAVAGPITYDLASLLEDARRDLPADLVAAMRTRYLAAMPQLDRAAFDASWAAMAAHRHVKCLGLFVRLAKRDGKPNYLPHIPRLWRLLDHALAHPALKPLAEWLAVEVPPDQRVVPKP